MYIVAWSSEVAVHMIKLSGDRGTELSIQLFVCCCI